MCVCVCVCVCDTCVCPVIMSADYQQAVETRHEKGFVFSCE